jgi:hypothetical protein
MKHKDTTHFIQIQITIWKVISAYKITNPIASSQELKKDLIKIYCIDKCLLDLDPI